MSGLQIDSLTVRFDATIAVDEVTLHVVEGSVFALVGPSGCGKSSLLRAVAEKVYGVTYELIQRPKRRNPPEKIYPPED